MAFGQQVYTISGQITDAESGEDLIGVSVLVVDLAKGVATNSYGFYSLSLPEGTYQILYSYLGYGEKKIELEFKKDKILNIELSPSVTGIDEVVVFAERPDIKITSTDIGVEKLKIKEITTLPVIFGEKDILKTIQLLPGISSSSEGGTGFNVRGGSMGQNLILLDEASVYSPSHLMGFFSVFNSDAIKDVTIYKGGIPACYGGRASSVLDITMNNGNNKTFSGSGGIGLISTRLTLEGPVIKDKMSFIVSGRRTYGDLVAKLLFPENMVSDDMKFYFYDLNAKFNYTVNEKNRLFISGYFGRDVFELADDIGTIWGNTTGTVRWNHLLSENIFSNTSLIYSNFDYGFVSGLFGARLRSGIEDLSLKEDITWYIHPGFTIKGGMNIIYHMFSPGEVTSSDTIDFEETLREKRGIEGAFYIQSEQMITPRLDANFGIRLSSFSQLGPGWFYEYNEDNEPVDSARYDSGEPAYPYFAFEPRITINYKLSDKGSAKLSYNRMAQYLHLLSNTTTGSPTDIWIPSSNILKPVLVGQVSAGLFRNFLDNSIETSIEAYYKNIINSVDYEDGAEIIFDEHVESQILTGKGRSYGVEIFVKKKSRTLTGWISYTLSRTESRIEGINNFSWYPMKYDKTHDVALVLVYDITKRVTASGVWTYATGNAVTFPSGKYIVDNNPVPYYTERNGYRMPSYHRLDLSLTLRGKNQNKFKSDWNFSIYNVYNRHNAYVISFRSSKTVPGATEAVKLSLFGIVPSVTYNFRF
jgi:hypothetical protein